MDVTIVDFRFRPEREAAYAALAATVRLEVLVAGPAAPRTAAFAWEHLPQRGPLKIAALRRNLALAKSPLWVAVEPAAAELLVFERLAAGRGAPWLAWLDASQGAAWFAYLVLRAVGRRWEALPWRTGVALAAAGRWV